jgi:glycyl-tRNA synthetase
VLAAELPGLVSSLSFKKSMRWDGFGVAYSRPMRWLLALHGSTPIPFSYGGLLASTNTRVLRNAPQPQLQVQSAGSYLELLQQQSIQLDFASRRKVIWEGATAAAAEVGCFVLALLLPLLRLGPISAASAASGQGLQGGNGFVCL